MTKTRCSFLLVAAVARLATAAETVRFVDCVDQLIDLERLATLPARGEACAQWSSWDRRSRYDDAAGKYVGWDANGDGGGFIRKEGDRIVMAEIEGPGCIRRMWSALPEDGHVYIYLDGAEDPVIDLPFRDYFSGEAAPFNRSSLCYEAALGQNNYTPIPFQESCKIVADAGWGMYYQFTYTTFPRGTKVETLRIPLTPPQNAALDAADARLRDLGKNPAAVQGDTVQMVSDVRVAPGSDAGVAVLEGPRAITGLRVKLDLPPPPGDRAVLRQLALSITWDDEPKPSVWTPLGDFFGTGPGANQYCSLPLGLDKDGWWYSYWYMPFGTRAAIELTNCGDEERALSFEITHAPLSAPIETLGRFHAKWHRDAFIPVQPERAIDWTMLKTEGRGRFCGVMLNVWNGRGGWWGEGDEKFFVDGEKFPSTFGTGSEDYFGYAWCNPGLFARAFHNQTLCTDNIGHVSVNRWHVVDNVPFQSSFEGAIEKYFPNTTPTLYDAVVYWYLAPGGNDPYGTVPIDQRMEWPAPVIRHVPGVIEGESLHVMEKTGGNPGEQMMLSFGRDWSGDAQFWWLGAKPGDTLDLALDVEEDGTYTLIAQLTKAPDYGIVQLYLDGRKLGDPIDLYNRAVVVTGELDFGRHNLEAGEHRLTMEITGANADAKKGYIIGLDYLKLKRKERDDETL